MEFSKQKEKSLNWDDKSKKGSIDIQIADLLDAINRRPQYYTTSSCAGRIDLIRLSETKRKDHSEWLYVTHDPARYEEIEKVLYGPGFVDNKGEIWFRMESAIVHVCAKSLDDAIDLLNLAKKAGFKHSGILSISKRVIVEIFGSEKIDTIVAKEGIVLIDKKYLKVLVEESNNKLDETRKRVEKLRMLIS